MFYKKMSSMRFMLALLYDSRPGEDGEVCDGGAQDQGGKPTAAEEAPTRDGAAGAAVSPSV